MKHGGPILMSAANKPARLNKCGPLAVKCPEILQKYISGYLDIK